MFQKISSFFSTKPIFRRGFILLFSTVAILGTAGSCSLPGIVNRDPTTFGILKRDPAVRQDGFVRANAVQKIDGQTDGQGMGTFSVVKMQQVSQDLLFALTREKGLFKSTDGGKVWKRQYIFPVGSNNQNQQQRTQEINRQVQQNDAFITSDFAVDPRANNIVYLAGKEDNLGKIYHSTDSGDTFKEIYTEVEKQIGVLFVAVDPINSLKIFAVLEKGALIRSLDGGQTWQKIRSFKDIPVQIGFVPEFKELFYILFAEDGLAFSRDDGQNWEMKELSKEPSTIGENQPKDGLDLSFENKPNFGRYEKIVPVTAGIVYDYQNKQLLTQNANEPWILIADRQMWYSENAGKDFRKLVLPVQNEQVNLYDVAPDPIEGLGKVYASIDNKLFVTRNRGQTWSTQDMINLSTAIGNISQILVSRFNSEIIYLCLVNKNATRNNGNLIF